MSKKYPECPLNDHSNCKDCYNPKLCAIVREDKVCTKKKPKSRFKKKVERTASSTDVNRFWAFSSGNHLI
jgi:hypothetical protein